MAEEKKAPIIFTSLWALIKKGKNDPCTNSVLEEIMYQKFIYISS